MSKRDLIREVIAGMQSVGEEAFLSYLPKSEPVDSTPTEALDIHNTEKFVEVPEAWNGGSEDADRMAIERYLNNTLVGAKAETLAKPVTIVVTTPGHDGEMIKNALLASQPLKDVSVNVVTDTDNEGDKEMYKKLLSAESPLPYPAIDPDSAHYSRRDRYLLKKERKAIKKRDPTKRWRT